MGERLDREDGVRTGQVVLGREEVPLPDADPAGQAGLLDEGRGDAGLGRTDGDAIADQVGPARRQVDQAAADAAAEVDDPRRRILCDQ